MVVETPESYKKFKIDFDKSNNINISETKTILMTTTLQTTEKKRS